MLKCVGIGGNRLLNGKGLNLGANKSGGGSDDEGGPLGGGRFSSGTLAVGFRFNPTVGVRTSRRNLRKSILVRLRFIRKVAKALSPRLQCVVAQQFSRFS